MAISADDERARLARADQLDAAGRHGEALDVLAAAASAGGVAARTRVGVRLLLGDRAPALGPAGVDLLEQAARAGGGEAAALTAVLCAAGVFRKRDWTAALDWLLRAAELDAPNAAGALAALAGAPIPAPGAGRGALGKLRARIDPGVFTRAEPGRTVHADPSIRAFDAFASPAICAWLIGRARGRLKRAEIYNAALDRHEAHEGRSNSAANFNLLETDLVQIAVQSRMAAAAGAPFNHLEAPAVLHYSVGEQFAEHFDFVDPRLPDYEALVARDGQRVATFLVYLNEGYAGGETEFPRLGVSHKGALGDGLMFVNTLPGDKADVRTVHAGRAPRAGEKWIVSQFIRSRPALPGSEGGSFFAPPPPR